MNFVTPVEIEDWLTFCHLFHELQDLCLSTVHSDLASLALQLEDDLFLQNVTKRLLSWPIVCPVWWFMKRVCPRTAPRRRWWWQWNEKNKTVLCPVFFHVYVAATVCWRLIGGNCTHVTHCPLHNGISSSVLLPKTLIVSLTSSFDCNSKMLSDELSNF